MKREELLIGIDLGTSAVKAILVSVDGVVHATRSRGVEIVRSDGNRCEIVPRRYIEGLYELLRDLTTNAPRNLIRAMSICAASGNTLLLDEKREPVTNAISWLDRRTAGMERELWPELIPDDVYRRVGWPWNGTFPLAHLAWLRDNDPARWDLARFRVMNNEYIYHLLGGDLAIDPSKATTFYLYDQEARRWNEDFLAFLGVSEDELANIVPSGSFVGTIRKLASTETCLPSETKIVTGCFDHPAAARPAPRRSPSSAALRGRGAPGVRLDESGRLHRQRRSRARRTQRGQLGPGPGPRCTRAGYLRDPSGLRALDRGSPAEGAMPVRRTGRRHDQHHRAGRR